jgi:hypothetical protein
MAASESHPLAVRRLGVALVTVLLAFASACGREEAEAPSPAAEPEAAAAPVPRGTPRVGVVEQRVTLVSDGRTRTALLAELADKAGFALEIEEGVDPQPLVLDLRDVEVEQALALLLEGSAYGAFYEFDTYTAGHVLARVSVQAGPDLAAVAPRPVRMRRRAPEPGAMPDGEERRPAYRSAAEGQPGLEELAEQLDTTDAGIRAQVVSEIDPDGPGIAILAEMLSDDPDPFVRVAAAKQLGDTDTFVATRALLDALADPDPQVVVSALDGLEFAGDESVIPLLEPLLEHRDATVRTAAAEAIDFLE